MADAVIIYRQGDEVTSGVLYRRIYPSRNYFKDGRASSLNFLPDRRDGYVSMFRAAEVAPSDVLAGHDGFGLLEIGAEVLWAMGKRMTYQPEWGKGHVAVHGFSKRDEQARRGASGAAGRLKARRRGTSPHPAGSRAARG